MKSVAFVTDVFCRIDPEPQVVPRGSAIHLFNLVTQLRSAGIAGRVIQKGSRNRHFLFADIPVHEIAAESLADFREVWPEYVDQSERVHLNNVDCCSVRSSSTTSATIHTNVFIESDRARGDLLVYMKHLDCLAVVNSAYLEAFPQYGPKMKLIRNGVDSLVFVFRQPSVPRADQKITVFFPNIPSPKKDPELALEILRILTQQRLASAVELRVAGICPEGLRNSSQGQTNVRFLGELEYPDGMVRNYQAAHVVIIPSKSESSSLVALEAMACGTPVVAADIPGLNETIAAGRTGVLVRERSATTWARAILELCNDSPLYLALSRAARREVCERFSLTNMVKGYLAMWGG